MSGLLSIGRSAISSYGAALETVSQNIANAENGDYVRRDVVLGDATISGSLNPLYSAQSGLSGVRSARGSAQPVRTRAVQFRARARPPHQHQEPDVIHAFRILKYVIYICAMK